MARRIPVSVITGFLGSGKTTLLNHLLQQPALKDAAVLINEFGEVAIDHLLVQKVDENTLRLTTGCLCCAVRGDLVNTLRDLYAKRSRGAIPRFRRMLIETTGLADPAPILHTFMKDALMAARFRLDGVIALVDAVNGMRTLDNHIEAVKQVALADRLLLSKSDLCETKTVSRLRRRLKKMNPSAPILVVRQGAIDTASLLDAGLYNPSTKTEDIRRWLKLETYTHTSTKRVLYRHGRNSTADSQLVQAFCFRIAEPVQWEAFVEILESLIERHGSDLLRVKGVLSVDGVPLPVVVHGVQHIFHPPVALSEWPDDDRSSRLVFITRGLEDVITRTLRSLSPSSGEAYR